MVTALQYGRFEKPQGRVERIGQQEDPQAVIEAVHDVWWQVAYAALKRVRGVSIVLDSESLYNEAVALLQPHAANLPSSIDKNIEDLLDLPEGRLQSIFASALINVSPAAVVVADGPIETLGYKLAHGKVLVLGKNSTSGNAGEKSMGTIINFGELDYLGLHAEKGMLVNKGSVYNLASSSNNVVSVNCEWALSHGTSARGGVHVNLSDVRRSMGGSAHSGLFVNLDDAFGIGVKAYGGHFINADRAVSLGQYASKACRFVNADQTVYTEDGNCYVPPNDRVSELLDDFENGAGFFYKMLQPGRATQIRWNKQEGKVRKFEVELMAALAEGGR